MKSKKITAINDTVVVKPFEFEEEHTGNIIVPDLDRSSSKLGKVISVGEGSFTSNGSFIPTQIKVGDIVVLPPTYFVRFEFNGEEYFSGSERYILCKIEK